MVLVLRLVLLQVVVYLFGVCAARCCVLRCGWLLMCCDVCELCFRFTLLMLCVRLCVVVALVLAVALVVRFICCWCVRRHVLINVALCCMFVCLCLLLLCFCRAVVFVVLLCCQLAL